MKKYLKRVVSLLCAFAFVLCNVFVFSSAKELNGVDYIEFKDFPIYEYSRYNELYELQYKFNSMGVSFDEMNYMVEFVDMNPEHNYYVFAVYATFSNSIIARTKTSGSKQYIEFTTLDNLEIYYCSFQVNIDLTYRGSCYGHGTTLNTSLSSKYQTDMNYQYSKGITIVDETGNTIKGDDYCYQLGQFLNVTVSPNPNDENAFEYTNTKGETSYDYTLDYTVTWNNPANLDICNIPAVQFCYLISTTKPTYDLYGNLTNREQVLQATRYYKKENKTFYKCDVNSFTQIYDEASGTLYAPSKYTQGQGSCAWYSCSKDYKTVKFSVDLQNVDLQHDVVYYPIILVCPISSSLYSKVGNIPFALDLNNAFNLSGETFSDFEYMGNLLAYSISSNNILTYQTSLLPEYISEFTFDYLYHENYNKNPDNYSDVIYNNPDNEDFNGGSSDKYFDLRNPTNVDIIGKNPVTGTINDAQIGSVNSIILNTKSVFGFIRQGISAFPKDFTDLIWWGLLCTIVLGLCLKIVRR